MKKKLTYFVMSLSMALSLVSSPLAVHANSFGETSYSQAESKTATTTTSTTTTDDSTGRTSRLDAYKKNLKETLTAAVKERIAARCVAAQAIVKAKTTNNTAVTTSRETAYDAIIGELQAVVSTASEQNVDVTALQANIAALQAKIVSFKSANTTYQQALADLGAMDCKTDPTAFKAALEAARTDQAAVFTSAKDIRTYLNETVKVTLKALKTKLKS